MKLFTRIISDEDEFANCRDEWNAIAADRVFQRWEWMHAWWQEFGVDSQLAIVLIADDRGRWVGFAPWYRSRMTARGVVVQQIGSGSACSDYTGVAVRRGYEAHAARLFVEIMSGSRHRAWFGDVDLFLLEGHLVDDPAMRAILDAATESGLASRQKELAATWVASLPDSWDVFEKSLSRSFQRKTRKAVSRLSSPEFETIQARTSEEIAALWPDFVQLHQARRQSINEPGCFADDRFTRFLCRAALDLAEAGMTRIHLARNQGRALAATLEFVAGGRAHMYQCGMDPAQTHLEPGHLIFARAIRCAIDEGCHEFDFLRGDEPYKARWNAKRMPLRRTTILPPRWKARMRYGIWSAGKTVRDWARARPSSLAPIVHDVHDSPEPASGSPS